MFRSVPSLLRAITADDVSPLAVIQIESIGTCFHINGEIANEIPELLTRCKSVRLERLSVWAGWMVGDTASAMAETAGGRAGSLLSLMLVELYYQNGAGKILYEVSSKILPQDQSHASMAQLSRVATTLSNKLGAIGFGTHLATQVTRIRETYFNSGLEIPGTLLYQLSTTSMVELLVGVHRALTEEASMLYVEGCEGIGIIVALLTALCPDDVSVAVENETIFQGKRQSISISIRGDTPTRYEIETVLIGVRGQFPRPLVSTCPEKGQALNLGPMRLKWRGCLAAMLDLAFVRVGVGPTAELRSTVADLIASIAFTMPLEDHFQKTDSRPTGTPILPQDGFRSILGPLAYNRVRDILAEILLAEPSFASTEYVLEYERLDGLVRALVPKSACKCSQSCFDTRADVDRYQNCSVHNLWRNIEAIVSKGVASLFITSGQNTTVNCTLNWRTVQNPSAILMGTAIRRGLGRVRDLPVSYPQSFYDTGTLHMAILDIVGKFTSVPVGYSSGSCSIFPSTLQTPILTDPPCLEYKIEDGRFHDGRCYYQRLYCGSQPQRSYGKFDFKDLPWSTIISSSLGVHSALMMTARPSHHGLLIRTTIQFSGTDIELNFWNTNIAAMGVSISQSCGHDPRTPLNREEKRKVVATSVASPLAEADISITLTQGSPEAQFLCCGPKGARILLQSNCCLNCVVKEAKAGGFNMVIQS
jgi:hypothetical protein